MDDQHVTRGLSALADEHVPRPVDIDHIATLAVTRTRRRAVVASALTVTLLAAGAVAVSSQLVEPKPPASTTTAAPAPVTPSPGRWLTTEFPGLDPSRSVELASAAGITDTDVWTVGATFDPANPLDRANFAARWNGRTWQQSPVPAGAGLRDVVAFGPDDAWVVGTANTPGGGFTAHWNGREWTQVPSSTFDGTIVRSTTLLSLSARSPNDIWAVGCDVDGPISRHPVIQHWNGQRWRLIPAPALPIEGTCLNSVAALSDNDVWAVGYTPAERGSKPLAIHWNGQQWSILEVAPPFGPAHNGSFKKVVALSPTDVWLFGGYTEFAQHFDGQKFTHVETPANVEFEVTAAIPNGQGGLLVATFPRNKALTLLNWTGTTWTATPGSIVPPVQSGPLNGSRALVRAIAVTPTTIWAIGTDSSNKTVRPLAALTAR